MYLLSWKMAIDWLLFQTVLTVDLMYTGPAECICNFLPIISRLMYLILQNRLRWKSFAVAELNFNSLENICGWMVVLHGKAYCTGYFTGKVSRYRSIRETCPT